MTEVMLVIYLTFNGFSMSIDPEQMYGITKLEECNTRLPQIIDDYSATYGSCFIGSLTERLERV